MVSSKQDILPLRFVQLEEKAISECISCGICVDVCPCIPMSKLQDMNSEKISREVVEFLKGGSLSEIVIERAFACCRCGVCIDICPVGINVYNLQQVLRSEILAAGKRQLTLNQLRIGNRIWGEYDFDNILASIQIKPSEKRWVDGIPQNVQGKNIILFLGCSTRRYVDKVNTTLDILEMLGLDFLAIGGGAICCGARAQIAGRLEEADTQGLRLISTLARYKPNEVLVICPACLYMMKKEIPNFVDVPFQTKHVLEVIADNLERLHFSHPVNKKVAFHDPCKLGRMCGDNASARKILQSIPGIKLVEMSQRKEDVNCCGGTAWRYNPQYAKILRKKTMDYAEAIKVDALATACLFCYLHFWEASSEYHYDVFDVIELVGEGLGIRYENKLLRFLSYHDSERVIEETKDYIEESPYSIEEMRQLLAYLMP
jgi:heterodisulfide reductase subunit D